MSSSEAEAEIQSVCSEEQNDEYPSEQLEAESDSNDEDLSRKKTKKPKKAKKDLGDTLAKILQRSTSTDAPILAKYKVVDKRISEETELKKKQAVKRKEKHELLEKDHFPKLDPALLNYEKRLKKIATREVVKLFNVINSHQKSVKDVKKDKIVSKENFLEMLKK